MTARRSRAAREPSTPEPAPAEESEEATASLPFEDGLARLEDLVGKLEAGQLPLEGALEAFEEGVRLSRQLDRQLDQAEQRVEVLLREGGRWVTEALDPDEAEET